MPLSLGGSGRLYRLCLPAGAVKPPQNKNAFRAVLRPRRRLNLYCAVDLPQVAGGIAKVTPVSFVRLLFPSLVS